MKACVASSRVSRVAPGSIALPTYGLDDVVTANLVNATEHANDTEEEQEEGENNDEDERHFHGALDAERLDDSEEEQSRMDRIRWERGAIQLSSFFRGSAVTGTHVSAA